LIPNVKTSQIYKKKGLNCVFKIFKKRNYKMLDGIEYTRFKLDRCTCDEEFSYATSIRQTNFKKNSLKNLFFHDLFLRFDTNK